MSAKMAPKLKVYLVLGICRMQAKVRKLGDLYEKVSVSVGTRSSEVG